MGRKVSNKGVISRSCLLSKSSAAEQLARLGEPWMRSVYQVANRDANAAPRLVLVRFLDKRRLWFRLGTTKPVAGSKVNNSRAHSGKQAAVLSIASRIPRMRHRATGKPGRARKIPIRGIDDYAKSLKKCRTRVPRRWRKISQTTSIPATARGPFVARPHPPSCTRGVEPRHGRALSEMERFKLR